MSTKLTSPLTIKIPAGSLKPYLNRALLFIKDAKLGLSPLLGCLYLKADKCFVYNGETGAELSMPFSVTQPTLLFPFELAKVVNAARELTDVLLTFDYKAMVLIAETTTIRTRIRLLATETQDLAILDGIKVPPDMVPFAVEGLYERIKRSSFTCSEDASLPLLQGVRITKESICTTDQRAVWREQGVSSEAFVIPKLLREHIERLGQEPSRIGLMPNQLYVFYNDLVCFGGRLEAEKNEKGLDRYPDVDGALVRVRAQDNAAVVSYDREALAERVTALLSLPQYENAVTMKCVAGLLSVQNAVGAGVETESVISMAVQSTADFDSVHLNGQLLLEGVSRFSQFAVKADQRRLLFWNGTSEYAVSRRNVQ